MARSALEIVAIDAEPIGVVRYRNAVRGGGTASVRLLIERGTVRGLPPGLDAIIATSDLQGVVLDPQTRASTLLGCAVAEALEELAFDDVVPAAAHTGVVLAGDLYSVPEADKRGGHGDVAAVWQAFAERFAWVAGVAGNHDDVSQLVSTERVRLLDTEVVELGGLRIGGVGLIGGNPARRGRRDEDEQLERLGLVAVSDVDLLLCHEGPTGDADQLGHSGIRALLEEHQVPLTVCGHVHWPRPLAHHGRGQILNVDARVIVLTGG